MSADRKQCAACDKPFGPSSGERRHVWLARKYCSHPCFTRRKLIKSDVWRAKETKVCICCGGVFRPYPGMRRGVWQRKTVCDGFCSTAAGLGQRMAVADPLNQVQPYQRLKWLRLSASRCRKKTAWSREHMAAACELSASTLGKIECGGGVTGGWIPAAAARLGVPASLFTVPVERFAKIVTEAGLSAKLSVPKKKRAAA